MTRRPARTVARALLTLAALALLATCAGAAAFVAWPLPEALLARRPASSLRILDAEGGVLRELRGADGRSVPLEDDRAPPSLAAAFIAAEDQRFRAHVGVDVRAIVRAAKDSILAGEIVSGASTIPQQLARRLVPRERTLFGKAGEALWALRLSAHLDKERVLVEYLNRVPLGRGTVGVEAAADAYFGKRASSLSLAESALLAGLAHAPSREDPFVHAERALARRAFVLRRMLALGLAERDAVLRALDEPLDLAGARPGQRAPHFVDAIVSSLDERGLAEAVALETTIDPALQAMAERVVAEELGVRDESPLSRSRVGQAAVIVLDNATGAVLAYVGSRDWRDASRGGMNDGVRARRQPGSALKPFVYGMALTPRGRGGAGMTAATILPDVELTMATETGTYAPRNYDKRVHGPVRLRAALQNSYNIPAVSLAEGLGPRRVLDGLRAAGFDSLDESPEHYGVGIVLGNGDVTLLELARAYRGLARGGLVEPVVDVAQAIDGAGASLPVPRALQPRRFLGAEVAELLAHIMSDGAARSPAFGIDNALDLPFPVAAKTGTSRAYVDNWTAGFTAERTVAVWAGNFDGTPMKGVSGITGAGTIFRRVMMAAMRDVRAPAPLFSTRSFDHARVCPLSGQLAGAACPGALDEVFLPGTAPRTSCAAHVMHDGRVLVDLEPRYRPWARAEGFALADEELRGDERSLAPAARRAGRAARLLSPRDGDEFVREPGIPAGQGVPVKLDAPGVGLVEVRVDGRAPVRLGPPHALWIDAEPGAHRLRVVDATSGAALGEASFTVR